MLFDRTKLHEFRLWYHFGYFRYLPNLMQKIGIALPSCIRQRALLLHWPGSWLLVGLERPKQVIPTEFYHRLLAFEHRSSFVRNPYAWCFRDSIPTRCTEVVYKRWSAYNYWECNQKRPSKPFAVV